VSIPSICESQASQHIACSNDTVTCGIYTVSNCNNVNIDTLNHVKTMSGMKLIHLNISTLLPNLSELTEIVTTINIDIVSLNETRLDGSITDSQLSIPGYVLLRKDRNRNGGGVALYIHKHMLPTPSDVKVNTESVWATVKTKNHSLTIGSIYRPPSSTASYFEDILDDIENASQRHGHELIILGDFNFNCLTSDGTTVNILQNTFDLKQLITTPTRITLDSSTLIDHIYIYK
jgi:exonuclease III